MAVFALLSVTKQARADHEIMLILLGVGTPLAQSTLMPGYASTIYYAKHPEKRMPRGWAVMNTVSGVMAGTLGLVQFGVGVAESGGSSDKRQLRPILIAAGAADILGSGIVMAASYVLRTRPIKSVDDFSVLPMAPSSPQNPVAGVVVTGRF
ncbi:MAG TPA: hypothetical protein PK156_13280 [Polyangium sp.]|nr:hypothetical protein [Polyangium sp.]